MVKLDCIIFAQENYKLLTMNEYPIRPGWPGWGRGGGGGAESVRADFNFRELP